MKHKLVLLKCLCAFLFMNSKAQQILISPGLNNGGFESGMSDWNIINHSDSKWYIGSASVIDGTKSAYIGTDSSNNNYSSASIQFSHLWTNVTIPNGNNYTYCSFDIKGLGQVFPSYQAALSIYLVPDSFNLIAGQAPPIGYRTYSVYGQNFEVTRVVAELSNSNAYAYGVPLKLVFVWNNSTIGVANPAVTIDNIFLTSSAPGCYPNMAPFPLQQNYSGPLWWTPSLSNPDSFRVYLGTNNPPDNLVNGFTIPGGQFNNYFYPNNLKFDSTYYWRVDRMTNNVTTSCVSRKFTYGHDTYYMTNDTTISTCKLLVTHQKHATTGAYIGNQNRTLTITPAIPGNHIFLKVNGFNIQAGDSLKIYDGPGTTDSLMGAYSGTTIPNSFYAGNNTGKITIQFVTNALGNTGGWELLATCVSAQPSGLPGQNCATAIDIPYVGYGLKDQSTNWMLDDYNPGTSGACLNQTTLADKIYKYNAMAGQCMKITLSSATGSSATTIPVPINSTINVYQGCPGDAGTICIGGVKATTGSAVSLIYSFDFNVSGVYHIVIETSTTFNIEFGKGVPQPGSIVVWDGSADSIFTNPQNWNNGFCEPVYVNNSYTYLVPANVLPSPVIPAGVNVYIGGLIIESGAIVTNKTILYLYKDITNNGTFIHSPSSLFLLNGNTPQTMNGDFTGSSKFRTVYNNNSTNVQLHGDMEASGSLYNYNSAKFYGNGHTITLGGDFYASNVNNFTSGSGGKLIFNGGSNQSFYNSTDTIETVEVNKSGGVLNINSSLKISPDGNLLLTNGKIVASSASIETIIYNRNPGSVSSGSTNSFVQGKLRRYLNPSGSYDFPIGHSTKGFQRANINFTSSTLIDHLSASFQQFSSIPGSPNTTDCGGIMFDAQALDNGYWRFNASNDSLSGVFDLTLFNTNFSNPAAAWTIMQNPGNTGWDLANGNCVSAAPIAAIQRTDMNGISDFAIAQASSAGVISLNLKLFLQGYYTGASLMSPVMMNQGMSLDTTIVDTVVVELHSGISPFGLVATTTGILKTNGIANCSFLAPTGNYYIVIKHRNSIETWSANPVYITSIPVIYDFSLTASQAYGSNMVHMDTNVWALFSGDVNQDENSDLLDLSNVEIDISLFQFGYITTDINGDGNVDLLDTPILEHNVSDFIFSNHP